MPDRFVVLDSWRGIAACAVALLHFRIGVNSHVAILPFFKHAALFVDFFFVLSGFVIFANYAERLTEGFGIGRFMLLRFGRLYPLHVFVLSVYVGFELLQVMIPQLGALAVHAPFSQEGESIGFIISSLFLVQALGFYDDGITAFSGPSWSISTEFYAYALFAGLLVILKNHIRIGLILLLLISGCFLFHSEMYLKTTLKYGFIRCVFGFSAGAMLWYWFTSVRNHKFLTVNAPILWSVIETALIVILFLFISYGTSGANKMFATPLFVIVIFVFAFEKGLWSHILKYKFFVLLGTLSYSIYLLHSFIAGKAVSVARYISKNMGLDIISISKSGEKMLGSTIWQGDGMTILYLFLVIICSLITYKIIEAPSRKYIRRLASGRN